MKSSSSSISKLQIKKHSIILPLIICICIIILIMIINSYYEKFVILIGKYEFLAPVKDTINDDMWQLLYSKMIKNDVTEMSNNGSTIGVSIDSLKKTYTNFVTKKEINYYLENSIFPWNPYITKLFVDFISGIEEPPKNMTPDDLLKKNMKEMPARYAYSQYLLAPDMKESLKSDSYLIYNGEKTILF